MGHVYIIGMGPGKNKYLTTEAITALKKADVYVGSLSQLKGLGKLAKKTFTLTHNYTEAVDYITKQKKKHNVAVLVSGDPGIFSFAKNICLCLDFNEYTIIPGISSVQIAYARFGLIWQDALIISLHARSKRGLAAVVKQHANVCILNDLKNTPKIIAEYLYKKGIRRRSVYIGENLGRIDEAATKTTLKELRNTKSEFKSLCVMILAK